MLNSPNENYPNVQDYRRRKKTDDWKEMMKNGLREEEYIKGGKMNGKIHSGMRERPKKMWEEATWRNFGVRMWQKCRRCWGWGWTQEVQHWGLSPISDMKRGAPTPLERLETQSCLCLMHTRIPRCTLGDSPVQGAVALLRCATTSPLPWQVVFWQQTSWEDAQPTQDGASPMAQTRHMMVLGHHFLKQVHGYEFGITVWLLPSLPCLGTVGPLLGQGVHGRATRLPPASLSLGWNACQHTASGTGGDECLAFRKHVSDF